MRLTNKLYAQHLGWMFKKHWQVQGQRVPRDTGAAAELEKLGIKVKDVTEVLAEKPKHQERLILEDLRRNSIPEDETHPNWHSAPCHIFGDTNVLLEGMPQAQLLTKTVEINGLPRHIEEAVKRMQLPSGADRNMQNSIMAACVYDAEQVKLPKVKIPERPAFNLPRQYGISSERKHRLLVNKLIHECEKLAGHAVTRRRQLFDNADFRVTLLKDNDLLQFGVSAEKLITTNRSLEPVKGSYDAELPDLHPIKCTITIPKKNIYLTNDHYPLSLNMNCGHPHTMVLHFNTETVKNLHGSPVTTTQMQSRSLLKAFAVAAMRAKQLYGDAAVDARGLTKPITVQCIQTDGRVFHFGLFQLNTLALDGTEGTKNYFFHEQNMDLYTQCGYRTGKPVLEGYNKDVLRYVNAFYNNA